MLASRKKKIAEARSPLTPLLSSLSTLALTTPVAMLVHGATKHGAAITFAMGVAWAAMRFGWRGALPLAATSVAANNFFIQPPAFAFQAVTAFEVYVFAGLLFMSFSHELIAWYEGGAGAFLRRCFPIVSANLYIPHPVQVTNADLSSLAALLLTVLLAILIAQTKGATAMRYSRLPWCGNEPLRPARRPPAILREPACPQISSSLCLRRSPSRSFRRSICFGVRRISLLACRSGNAVGPSLS